MAGSKQLPPVSIVPDFALDPVEKAAVPVSHLSLREAVESGTRLDELKAMRRILVAHMESENTLARDLAALTRQVREISKEIEGLEVQEAERAKAAEEDGGSDGGTADAEWDAKAV